MKPFRALFIFIAGGVLASAQGRSSAITPVASAVPETHHSNFVFSLLPKSFQKKPRLEFNVITEMTPEGRKVAPPSPGQPIYYVAQAGKFIRTGSALTDNEHAPPRADLEQAMQRALAANGFVVGELPAHRPGLVVVFNYGSHSMDPPLPPELADEVVTPPQTAEELLPIIAHDVNLQADLIERAALIGGNAFALRLKRALIEEVANMTTNYDMQPNGQLPVSPNPASPFQLFLSGKDSDLVGHLVEDAFHSCYFVVASAYDYDAMSHGQKRLLWRTKMTVDASGVNMTETLAPLIASAGPYFGRDMAEASIVEKRISREGKVEIGTATVVEDKRSEIPPPVKP